MHVRSGHDRDCVRAVNLHIVISQIIFNCKIYLKLTFRIESNLQDLKSSPQMISMIEKFLLVLISSSLLPTLLCLLKLCRACFDLNSRAFNVHPQATETRSFEQLVILGRLKRSSISCADKMIYSLFDKAGVPVISYS